MFTGLIEDVGSVVKLERRGASARLSVKTALPLAEIKLGDSVAVNGVCLTVVDFAGGVLSFDVSPETIERSSFKGLQQGAAVNLERALRLSDRLGGHLVSGHVDCIAILDGRREISGNIVLTFRIPAEYSRYLVEKGSVAIDGISLTVNAVSSDSFSVNIIPHTADRTTLHLRRPGDRVNIETDIIGKYLERLLEGRSPEAAAGLTMEALVRNGFI
jgi:riboflavin synthase